MKKVLEFILWYVFYLVTVFLGIWLGSLITGTDINPFTSWIPYTLAIVLLVIDYLFITKDMGE